MIAVVFAAALALGHTPWVATSIDGAPVTAHHPTLELDPTQMRASGSSGCNRFTGGYAQHGWHLRFEAIAGTRMMCPPEQMRIEDAFTAALERVRSYRIVDGRLALYAADGSLVLRFRPAERR